MFMTSHTFWKIGCINHMSVRFGYVLFLFSQVYLILNFAAFLEVTELK